MSYLLKNAIILSKRFEGVSFMKLKTLMLVGFVGFFSIAHASNISVEIEDKTTSSLFKPSELSIEIRGGDTLVKRVCKVVDGKQEMKRPLKDVSGLEIKFCDKKREGKSLGVDETYLDDESSVLQETPNKRRERGGSLIKTVNEWQYAVFTNDNGERKDIIPDNTCKKHLSRIEILKALKITFSDTISNEEKSSKDPKKELFNCFVELIYNPQEVKIYCDDKRIIPLDGNEKSLDFAKGIGWEFINWEGKKTSTWYTIEELKKHTTKKVNWISFFTYSGELKGINMYIFGQYMSTNHYPTLTDILSSEKNMGYNFAVYNDGNEIKDVTYENTKNTDLSRIKYINLVIEDDRKGEKEKPYSCKMHIVNYSE